MQTTYTPPGPYDALMESDLRKVEKRLPATPRAVQEKTLLWMVAHEPENPEYYGPRILAMSLKLGV